MDAALAPNFGPQMLTIFHFEGIAFTDMLASPDENMHMLVSTKLPMKHFL